MNIRSKIAAARALAPRDMIKTVRVLQRIAPSKPMADLCDALERACELLEELDEDLGPDSLSVRIRAFLAGEVTRG